jgi:hypothetical protein
MKDKLQSTASLPVRLPRITRKTLAWAVVLGAYPFASFLLGLSPPPRKPKEGAPSDSSPTREVGE